MKKIASVVKLFIKILRQIIIFSRTKLDLSCLGRAQIVDVIINSTVD